MKHNLKHIFRDIAPGSVCTGTIKYFGLHVKKLRKLGIVKVEERTYYPYSYSNENLPTKLHPTRHDEYIFQGFIDPDENFDNVVPGVSDETDEKATA